MIRVGKMTPRETRWEGCHFPHSCLFMLNSPWVTARPWQNKIRAPFCTSISLSHGIGWRVSGGKELCTWCNVQVCFSPLLLPSHHHIFNLSIPYIYFGIFFLSALSSSLFLFFFLFLLFICFISLCLSLSTPASVSSPLPHSASLHGLPRLKTQGGFRFC